MATFLVRAFDLGSADAAGFSDTASSVHAADIDALAAVGITLGCAIDPLRYCPDQPLTLGQMATFQPRPPVSFNQLRTESTHPELRIQTANALLTSCETRRKRGSAPCSFCPL